MGDDAPDGRSGRTLPERSQGVTVRAARNWEDLRAEFGLLTAMEVAFISDTSPTQTVKGAAAGYTLGIVVDGELVWPGSQFDEGGTVAMVVAELIALADRFNLSQRDLTVLLCSPSGWFTGRARPVDLLHTDPRAVLTAVERHMQQERW